MRNKKWIVSAIALAVFTMASSVAMAVHYGGSHSYHKSIKDKFFGKAHKVLIHEDEIGLSQEQHDKIVALKVATKKDLIMKEAEIETIAVDIRSALYRDPINVETVGALIDKKYEIKKAKTKMLLGAYATLKSTLTEEQKAKMKALKEEMKSEWSKGSGYHKGSHGKGSR